MGSGMRAVRNALEAGDYGLGVSRALRDLEDGLAATPLRPAAWFSERENHDLDATISQCLRVAHELHESSGLSLAFVLRWKASLLRNARRYRPEWRELPLVTPGDMTRVLFQCSYAR